MWERICCHPSTTGSFNWNLNSFRSLLTWYCGYIRIVGRCPRQSSTGMFWRDEQAVLVLGKNLVFIDSFMTVKISSFHSTLHFYNNSIARTRLIHNLQVRLFIYLLNSLLWLRNGWSLWRNLLIKGLKKGTLSKNL